jgi:beta-lactamase class A
VEDPFGAIFGAVGCAAAVCAQTSDGAREVGLCADDPVVAASVIKVLVAVEVERQIGSGKIDPDARVRLQAKNRTPGPVGFSLYERDVDVTLGDLVVPMLTISDNAATDALLAAVGVQECNETARSLDLTATVIVSDLATTIHGIAEAAGFRNWHQLTTWSNGPHDPAEQDAVTRRVRAAPQMQPETATRTTARDMTQLLRLIWRNEAAPPDGCARIRRLMAQQLTRHRIASGFGPGHRVAAKSGGLLGVFRHEVGVVAAGGSWWPVAIFTTTTQEAPNEAAISSAIGTAAAHAIQALSD